MESIYFLFYIKTLLMFFPIKFFLKGLKDIEEKEVVKPELLAQIKINIARANRLAFWKNQCLVKSLAARKMLDKRQISSRLSLGMKMDEKKYPLAHAWIVSHKVEIVGKEQEFLELFSK